MTSNGESNRDKVLRGEVVKVTDDRLREMQSQAIALEGVGDGTYHWHWAAVLSELIARRTGTLPAVETFGKEAWRVALPKITEQHAADFVGYRSLMEFKGSRWEWTQDAVDFACMLQGVRQEAMQPEEPSGLRYRHDWEALPGPSYRCKRCSTTCIDAHTALLCVVEPEKASEQCPAIDGPHRAMNGVCIHCRAQVNGESTL